MADIDPVEAENLLLGLYEDEVANSDFGFFEYVGLPRDASWGQFRRHYDKDGVPDSDRVSKDIFTYPPVARRVAELRAGKKSKVISLRDWAKHQGPNKPNT